MSSSSHEDIKNLEIRIEKIETFIGNMMRERKYMKLVRAIRDVDDRYLLGYKHIPQFKFVGLANFRKEPIFHIEYLAKDEKDEMAHYKIHLLRENLLSIKSDQQMERMFRRFSGLIEDFIEVLSLFPSELCKIYLSKTEIDEIESWWNEFK